jgi:hypothetical protein
MNDQKVKEYAGRLAAERGWPDGSPLATMLLGLLMAREEARDSLRSHLAGLTRDIARLDKMLNNPSPILNTLGELQGRPAKVEAHVGAFVNADSALRLFLDTFPKD